MLPFFPFLPLLLHVSFEQSQWSLNNAVQLGNLRNIVTLSKNQEMVDAYFKRIQKIEVSLETVFQLSIQIVLVIQAATNTRTKSGLEAFFTQNDFFGMNGYVFLALMTGLSLFSVLRKYSGTYFNANNVVPFKSQIILLSYAFIGLITRIIYIVLWFTPFLGLFDTFWH